MLCWIDLGSICLKWRQWLSRMVFFENPFFNGLLADDVLFDDSFDAIGRNVGVPNSVWPDQKNRPSFAHPEAIHFASQHNPLWAFRVFQIELTNNAFQFIPGL